MEESAHKHSAVVTLRTLERMCAVQKLSMKRCLIIKVFLSLSLSTRSLLHIEKLKN